MKKNLGKVAKRTKSKPKPTEKPARKSNAGRPLKGSAPQKSLGIGMDPAVVAAIDAHRETTHESRAAFLARAAIEQIARDQSAPTQ